METIKGVKHTKTKDAAVLKPKYCFLHSPPTWDASAPLQTHNSSVLGWISSVEIFNGAVVMSPLAAATAVILLHSHTS